MASIKDNTVKSVNQVSKNGCIFYLGKKENAQKILIMGNSITRHGPSKEIGWNNDWGMAASARENDFVHVLFDQLSNDRDIFFFVRQASDWERRFAEENILDSFNEEKELNADIVVFRMGENSNAVVNADNRELYKQKVNELINYVKAPNTKVVFTTCFWENEFVDKVIREVAKENNYTLVELNDLGKEDCNMALNDFTHGGVRIHPNDTGMKKIADRIYKAIKNL